MADYISKLSAYEGCRVLIIGAGKSGVAAARLLSPVADKIVVSDAKAAEELGPIPYNIAEVGGSFVGGTQDESLLEGVDFVVENKKTFAPLRHRRPPLLPRHYRCRRLLPDRGGGLP